MAGTFQNLSGGRLLLNVVTGGESHEQRTFGDFLDKDARYARCDEFLTIVRGAVARRDRRLPRRAPPRSRTPRSARSPDPVPEIYFGGSVAGRRRRRRPARRRLPDLGRAAGRGGREDRLDPRARRGARAAQVRFGIRLHAITRDTAEEAWAEADRLLAGIDDDAIAAVQAGSRRRVRGPAPDARAPTAAAADDLEIDPNLWAGVGLVRGGAGTALVGSHERGRRPHRGVPRPRHRRVHPVRLPAPRGGLPVRRGRPADPRATRALEHPAPVRVRRIGAVRGRAAPRHERPHGRRGRQPEAGLAHARRGAPPSPAS